MPPPVVLVIRVGRPYQQAVGPAEVSHRFNNGLGGTRRGIWVPTEVVGRRCWAASSVDRGHIQLYRPVTKKVHDESFKIPVARLNHHNPFLLPTSDVEAARAKVKELEELLMTKEQEAKSASEHREQEPNLDSFDPERLLEELGKRVASEQEAISKDATNWPKRLIEMVRYSATPGN